MPNISFIGWKTASCFVKWLTAEAEIEEKSSVYCRCDTIYNSLYVLLGILEIGLLSKRVQISGFLCVLLFLSCPLMLCHQALLYFIWPFTEVCSKTWRASRTSKETRIQKHFFMFYETGTEEKKKILKLKWGNSTSYCLSQSNPVTIAKNMKRCKHGNKLLIWI